MTEATRRAALDDIHRLRLTGAVVEVVGGPDAGRSMEVGPSGLVVGSGSGCDVQLVDPLVSRRHLELRAEEEGVRLLDLGSTNGTLVGGIRVRDALITADAVVTVGKTSLAVRLSAEPLDVTVSPRTRFGDAIAHSAAMRHVFSLLEKAAR